MTPLLERVENIPHAFGMEHIESNHVEARALNLREELIPAGLPAIHIIDSQNVINSY